MLENIFGVRPKIQMPNVKPTRKVDYDLAIVLDAVKPLIIDATLPTLVIKSNVTAKYEEHKLRRRDLIEEYGGNVVLLRPDEEVISTTELYDTVHEFVEYIEKRRHEDNWDGKQLTDSKEFKKLKELISTK